MKYFIGIDLGGTNVRTLLVDENGQSYSEVKDATEREKGPDAVTAKICRQIEAIDYTVCGGIENVEGIGIGVPGPVDVVKGVMIMASNLPGFENYPIAEKLSTKFNKPVFLDNDANVATLGEFMFGAGKGTENMVFITASTGIGGGAVINGKLFRGTTGNALEIGHTIVANEGPRCGCGNIGCAEALGSGTAIGKRAKEAVATNAETSLKNYENVTSKEVFKEAANGDRVAKNILETSLNYLGIAVANTITNFDPEKVVIGGGVINGGSIVLDTIRRVVGERALKTFADSCTVEKAVLGGKAGVLGAAALAITEQ